jgi:hypothetical protein
MSVFKDRQGRSRNEWGKPCILMAGKRYFDFRQNGSSRCAHLLRKDFYPEEKVQGRKEKSTGRAEITSAFSSKLLHPQVNLAQWLWNTKAFAASQDDLDGFW